MSVADTLAIVMALSVQGDARVSSDLPPAAPQVTINGSPGGAITSFADRVIDYDRAGTSVRVMGPCVSACTLVLALPPGRICVGPRASFGFHQPFPNGRPNIATSDLGEAMVDAYPPFVRQWLKARGGMPHGRPQFMGYDELKRHYPTCT